MVYAATVDTLHLTFQASGSLWQDALVMHDRETGSLWSQITGVCISGPLEGKRLLLLPSRHTTYGEFKETYPDGRLLAKPAKGEAGSHYADYFTHPDRLRLGIFGRANTFTKLPGKAVVYGLRLGGEALAVAERYLAEQGFAVTSLSETPVIITYDPVGNAVAAFQLPAREIDTVTVEDGWIIYHNERTWQATTGAAAQPHEADLETLPLISGFWFAWVSFFPNTQLVK